MKRSLTNCCLAIFASAFLFAGCAEDDVDSADESTQEAELSGIPDVPSSYPTESGWSLRKVARACNLSSASLEGAVGSMARTADGVVYTATRSGRVIARASARHDSLFASATCL